METDVMELTTANKLEELFIAAANNPDYRPYFYEQLYSAEIYVIPQGKASLQDGVLEGGSNLKLLAVPMEGVPYVVFFTSQQKIAETSEGETDFLAMQAQDFFKLTFGSNLIMNPGSPLSKPFAPEEVAEIIQNNSGIMVSEIGKDKEPKQFADELSALFKNKPEVKSARFAEFKDPEKPEEGIKLLVLLDLKKEELLENFASEITTASKFGNKHPDHKGVQVESINGRFGFLKDVKPFYKKAGLFGF